MTRTVDLRKKNEKKEITPIKMEAFWVEPEKTKNIKEDASRPIAKKNINKLGSRFEWEAPAFYYNPQKKYPILIVILLLAGAGAILFYHMDTLTAIFLILSSIVLVLYSNKKPTMSKVVVNQASVTIDDTVYYYRDLKSFWLDYTPNGQKELSLESKKWYMPYIKVSIEKQNPIELRSLIIKFVSEKEHEKSLVDLISRRIGL